MRYVVIDIETSGLSISCGDRIIEIACVEIINNTITGKIFRSYINPGMVVSYKAYKIHGITNKFLKNKPRFSDIVIDLIKFINNDILVAHNAYFDRRFIENEFNIIGMKISLKFIDTLYFARKYFPRKKNSLGSLAKRFDISVNGLSHTACYDAMVLAKCFIIFNKMENDCRGFLCKKFTILMSSFI